MTNEELILISSAAAYINNTEYFFSENDIDYVKLFNLCEMHKLTSLVYTVLKKSGANIPDFFRQRALMSSVSVIKNTEEFYSVLSKLQKIGLDPVTVKGSAVRVLYPEAHVRPSSDEDIYINNEEKSRYIEFFTSSGFQYIDGNDVSTFISPSKSLTLEVHTSLFSNDYIITEKMANIFKNSLDEHYYITHNSKKIRTLSPTEHLLFLILHSLKHFIYCGFGLRQVLDFAVFAKHYKNEIDANKIINTLDSLSALGFFDALLKISEEQLGIGKNALGFETYFPKDTDTTEILNDILTGGIYGNTDPVRLHSSKLTLCAVDGRKHGVVSALFPPYKTIKSSYTYVDKYPFLLPAAYVQRILSYTVKEKKNIKKNSSASLEIGSKRISMLKQYKIIGE